jgi:hypothetical protein
MLDGRTDFTRFWLFSLTGLARIQILEEISRDPLLLERFP